MASGKQLIEGFSSDTDTEAAPNKFHRKWKNATAKTESKTRKRKQCRCTVAWEEQAARITSVVHLWHPWCRRERGLNGSVRCSAIIHGTSSLGPPMGHGIDAAKGQRSTQKSPCAQTAPFWCSTSWDFQNYLGAFPFSLMKQLLQVIP